MDSEAFRQHGKDMIDLVADYWSSMRDRQVIPDVKPGFIWDMIPSTPPSTPESWSSIMADIEPIILENNVNWQHPNFHAYFSSCCSYPAIIGDILSGGIASNGFSWKSSPSMTELEMAMMDWLAKSLGLPDHFLNSHAGPGAGVIQNSACDSTLIAILSARSRAVMAYKENKFTSRRLVSKIIQKLSDIFVRTPSPLSSFELQSSTTHHLTSFPQHDPSIIGRLVAYCSDQAHSSVDKGIMISAVKMRKLKTVVGGPLNNYYVEAETLEAAIKEDKALGLIPFIYIATVGSTNTCGCDQLFALGPICQREGLWLHVDSAYAGSFAICPENRYLLEGIEYVDSFNFNPYKAMLINFDCSPMWFKDAKEAAKYFDVDPEYLKHDHQTAIPDYRHLQIPLSRRFRSLKIWFVLRALGLETIQNELRLKIKLGEEFAALISKDENFELIVPPHLGLVCFRYKSDNTANKKLLNSINNDRKIHLVPAQINDKYFIRFAICSTLTTSEDIEYAYNVIKEHSQQI